MSIPRLITNLKLVRDDSHVMHHPAIEEVIAKLVEMDWQPIESAPRDGTALWVYCPTHEHVVAWWDQIDGGGHPENGPPIYWWVSDKVEFNDGKYDAPTHWKPLTTPSIDPITDSIPMDTEKLI